VTLQQQTQPLFDRSQVAEHNDEANGYWLIIDGWVYDVTELMRIHPGGPRILQLYAGRDASDGFRRVHHTGERLNLLLSRARLGRLRELACVTRPDHASHCAAARALHAALALVVEMQNALRADHAFQLRPLRAADQQKTDARRSRYELQRGIETHARFHREYLDVLMGVSLFSLAAAILPCDAQPALRARAESVQRSQPCAAARSCAHALLDRFESLTDADLGLSVARFEVLDSGLLRLWKRELSRGLRTLEGDHAAALRVTDIGVVHRLLDGVEEYFRVPAR
jgi:hypothetical protein